MFSLRPAQDEQGLLQASTDIARLLVAAVKLAPVTQSFFGQVAGLMVSEANRTPGTLPYGTVLEKAFAGRGIVPPANTDLQPLETGDTTTISLGEDGPDFAAVPTVRLAVPKYGFKKKSIIVKTCHHTAARSFLDDLVRTSCLKTELAPLHRKDLKMAHQHNHTNYEPYTHELRRQGKDITLRRVRFNCGHIPNSK